VGERTITGLAVLLQSTALGSRLIQVHHMAMAAMATAEA
jgi:hypothetical protein